MKIAGSSELPLVFRMEARARKVLVRVVKDLPYRLIIGAVFLRENASVISFAAGGGYKPSPESPWVPFISSTGGLSWRKIGGEVVGWRAESRRGNAKVQVAAMKNGATWEHFCAVKPSEEQEKPAEIIEPATQPIGGLVAW